MILKLIRSVSAEVLAYRFWNFVLRLVIRPAIHSLPDMKQDALFVHFKVLENIKDLYSSRGYKLRTAWKNSGSNSIGHMDLIPNCQPPIWHRNMSNSQALLFLLWAKIWTWYRYVEDSAWSLQVVNNSLSSQYFLYLLPHGRKSCSPSPRIFSKVLCVSFTLPW